eukprot:2974536-Prymnesium_polylepis.1
MTIDHEMKATHVIEPMLRPDGVLERHVPQSEWSSRFEQLLALAEEQTRQDDWMDVEEEEGDLAGALQQPTVDAFLPGAPRFDDWKKVEKYDKAGIDAALVCMQEDEAERARCKERAFELLAAERQKLGPADGFKAASVVLLAPNEQGELCVLLAFEQRKRMERFNFVGGKREPGEAPLQTAARQAFKLCAGRSLHPSGPRPPRVGARR